MVRIRRFGVALALAIVAELLAAGSSRADAPLAGGLPQAPKVSAADGAFAWSVYDPSAGAWRLMARRDGVTEALPIAPRATSFDVDLGHDGRGGLLASYSRCSGATQSAELPHGCRLYYYDFATRTERPIAVADASGFSEFLPTMAAGRVAYARIDDRRRVGAGNHAQIYVQSLDGGAPRRLPGGAANDDPRSGPTSLDLSARALAFSWDVEGSTPQYEGFGYGASEIRVDDLAGGQTLVALEGGGALGDTEELSPTLLGGTLVYGAATVGDTTAYELHSLTLPGGHAGVAAAPAGIASAATGLAGTIYSSCSVDAYDEPLGPPCEVGLVEHVTYHDPDEQVEHSARPTTISVGPQPWYNFNPGHTPGQWLAWSAYDPARHDYRLMVRPAGEPAAAAPVPPRRVPFDVQIGPLPGGGLAAVYSRCRVEPRLDPRDRLPLPATGRGCRLYRYDLGSRRERTIPGSGSRYLPSVWKSQLAFAEQGPGGRPALYLGSLNGKTIPRRLPAGPAGDAPVLGPRALTLRRRHVAFVWEYRTRSGLRSELRLDGPGAKRRLLDVASSRDGSARELSPGFTAGTLAWARRAAGGHSWLLSFALASHHRHKHLLPAPVEALAIFHVTPSLEVLPGDMLYARGDGHGGATIMRLGRRQLPLRVGGGR